MKGVKITKADVFSTNAKNYTKKTATRKNFIEALGLWVSDPLHISNRKLAANIAILSLMEGKTCINCRDCFKYCYARKASTQYKNVRAHRMIMSFLAVNFPAVFFDLVKKQLRGILANNSRRRVPVEFVRIHEAGDFFSSDYINGWAEVAQEFPSLKFYFYTECAGLFDFSSFASMHNVNMVSSRLPDGGVNFDDEDIIISRCEALGVPVCPYRAGSNNPVKCGAGCKLCMSAASVGFVKH